MSSASYLGHNAKKVVVVFNSPFYQIGLKIQIINFLKNKHFETKQHRKVEKEEIEEIYPR